VIVRIALLLVIAASRLDELKDALTTRC